MGQEFIIKSQKLEDKVNQLLPSQGGFQAGVDLSASTQIIPIVDLTETATGSQVREDLQTALSLNDVTVFDISNSTNSTIINTTGYYRIFGFMSMLPANDATACNINVTDGATTKNLIKPNVSLTESTAFSFDFVVFLAAGQTLRGTANAGALRLTGVAKQIASIDGTLTTPS